MTVIAQFQTPPCRNWSGTVSKVVPPIIRYKTLAMRSFISLSIFLSASASASEGVFFLTSPALTAALVRMSTSNGSAHFPSSSRNTTTPGE
ncbi:hypothetical protein WG66_000448 [Moniliophthora roreri]|nr:hypothetical protein WG66_000448 [Moniliophthora roreri]